MRLREFYDMAGEPHVVDQPPTQAPIAPVLPSRENTPKPGGGRVIIFDDDYTFIVATIYGVMEGARKNEDEALAIVRTAEREGRAIVGTYGSMEIAETIAGRILHYANQIDGPEGHPPRPWPLRCIAEPIE